MKNPERRKIPNPIFRELHLQRQVRRCNTAVLKRTTDIILSIIFLGLFSPLLLLTAILIKATSNGSVFFLQKRVGLGNSRFVFIKLRSMKSNADQSVHQKYAETLIKGLKGHTFFGKDVKAYKMVQDMRVTTVGKIIRKLSIDEIPQFINVLKGDMSIVGPRPPVPYELDFYNERAKKRLLVKPGITGCWQVNGRSLTTFERMIALDLYYIMHWSIWLDIKILLKTFYAVFDISKAY